MSTQVTARLIISGQVQGVSFRYHTRRTALARGVSGWVRNCADGTVETLLQGEPPDVEAVIAWCHEGPPAAAVSDVRVEWLDGAQEHGGFDIRR